MERCEPLGWRSRRPACASSGYAPTANPPGARRWLPPFGCSHLTPAAGSSRISADVKDGSPVLHGVSKPESPWKYYDNCLRLARSQKHRICGYECGSPRQARAPNPSASMRLDASDPASPLRHRAAGPSGCSPSHRPVRSRRRASRPCATSARFGTTPRPSAPPQPR